VRGDWCEVHHVEDWATTHCTDVNTLTLACGSDHPLIEPGGWTTRKRKDGTTEWIPHPISTTANREPTPSTTPKISWRTAMTKTKTTGNYPACLAGGR
jgi:hypothetical protein